MFAKFAMIDIASKVAQGCFPSGMSRTLGDSLDVSAIDSMPTFSNNPYGIPLSLSFLLASYSNTAVPFEAVGFASLRWGAAYWYAVFEVFQ